MKPRDIIGSDIRFPETVAILGPGPLGKPHWKELENYFTIVMNGAVTIPVKRDCWLIGDSNATETYWFREGLKRYDCMRIFSFRLLRKTKFRVSANYGFECVDIVDDLYVRNPKKFRLTEGIPGVALDMVTRFGARKVIMCGIDQTGQKYHDGKPARNLETGQAYVHCGRLARAIEMVLKDGIEIETISPTKLPRCQDGEGEMFQGRFNLSMFQNNKQK